MRAKNPPLLLCHKGTPIYHMMKDGIAMSFWYSLSKEGGREAEDNDRALLDGFDVREIPEKYRDGLDLEAVWRKLVTSGHHNRWSLTVAVVIRKALNDGYDLRTAGARVARLET